jgi:hypothetical protein
MMHVNVKRNDKAMNDQKNDLEYDPICACGFGLIFMVGHSLNFS